MKNKGCVKQQSRALISIFFYNDYLACIKYSSILKLTRKYPLRGYFLGVLTHTTAWDRLWRGDETLNCVVYTWLGFASPSNAAAVVAVASPKVYLTTLLSKVFSFNDFFGGLGLGWGRDGT